MRIKSTIVITVAAAALALTGCSSSGGGGSNTSAPATSAESSGADVLSPPATTTAPATSAAVPTTSAATTAAPSAPVAVNKKFTNPDLVESGTVLKYLRNFTVPAATKAKYSLLADDEVVLVEVTVKASTKYYDTLGSDSFFLLGNDGTKNAEDNSILTADMTAAGYPPLKDADTGKTSTGWIAFPVKKGFTTLTLRYYSLESKTSSGKILPAKNIDIKLV